MDLKEDSPVPTLVSPLKKGIEYLVEHGGDNLYMLTNLGGAQNFKILRSTNLDLENLSWEEFIPENDSVFIDNFSIYNDFMILETRNNELALPQLQIHNIKTRDNKIVKMDKQAYSLNFKGADDFNETKVRFYYQSPKGPLKTMDLDLKTGEQTVRKTQEVPNFDEGNYEVKRVYAPAHDGEEIPLTLLYKKGTPLNGSAPAYVYSYGSYGYSLPTNFSQPVLSLVDKGFIHVIAHIRGGSDKGYGWYLDGKMKNKLNTFKDFISSCEYLIKKKYTSLGNIVAHGGSAGGLLMGVVANMRPDLFKAVVADVPFVDMINTISDASLPLTPPEWEEWGNPIKNKDEFEYMMGYSPYDNIATQRYPNMLFNSGISDEQVTYWEPTKMVAKLRELKTDENLTLLNIKMHEGHSGASKRYEWIKEKAFTYAFILKCFD